jgi:hypothetical protein
MTNKLAAILTSFLLPAAAAAQLPVPLPKSLVFPNYDNVLLGKDQALEGGAYIARAGDASANFYNPAGLVQAEKTSLNASSTGWVRTKLTSEALNTSVTSSKIDNVPGYLGAVLEVPWVSSRNIRMGLSLTRQVAWAPGSIDISNTETTVEGLDRVTYSTSAGFTTQLYQVAVAFSPIESRAFRIGVSAGVADTSYSNSGTLSGLVDVGGGPGQFLTTLRATGDVWDAVFGAGVQWDVVAGLTVGAVVRSKGISIGNSSLVTYESSILTPAANPQTSFFRDDAGQFEYRLPLEASFGVAYRFGGAQIEADLRFHDATDPYDFYRSNVPLQITTGSGTGAGTSVSPVPLNPIRYSSRRVYNYSIGGNYALGRNATLHAGFYSSYSPVADETNSPFRKADLYGATGGVDFQFEHFGASIGAGYQWGKSAPTPLQLGNQQLAGSGITLQAISILYAISYQF